MAKIIEHNTTDFLRRNMVCHFVVFQVFIMDNGLQFDNTKFCIFWNKYKSKNAYATPAYPKSNRQVKAAKKVIKHHLKSCLLALNGGWPVELPYMLWAYRPICRIVTKETLFSLAYATEPIALIEIGMKIYSIDNFQVDQ